MDLASQMNISIKMTEKLVTFVGGILEEFAFGENSNWPLTYTTALNILKTKDYSEPIPSKICFDQ